MGEPERPDPRTLPTKGPDPEDSRPATPGGAALPDRSVGPYRILSEIGRGGMGIVYKAFHPALKRAVALKVLIAGEDASEEALERFRREASAVAKLGHHPNIVPVYDTGSDGRVHYIAMHFVEGPSLDRLLDEADLTPEQAAGVARAVASALAHAHANGVLHRDVKPANILLAAPEGERGRGGDAEHPSPPPPLPSSPSRAEGTHGSPMLTDFGLAKDVASESSVTRSGVTLGTPNYMPPEQAEGRLAELDERSDVYSLGACLYETLTHRPPVEGATILEVLQRVLLDWPVPPRRINPAVPRDLETLCLKCLEKDPARRYDSAAALAADLDRFLAGEPVRARPAPPWRKLALRARRNVAATAALAALGLLIVAGGILGLLALRARERQAEDAAKAASQRQVAEDGADAARRERERAERLLEKNRRAGQVLLAACMRLRDPHDRLKAATYDSGLDEAGRRAVFREVEAEVDAACAALAGDAPARAAVLAFRGWLLWHGAMPGEARACFEKARAADPEVVWSHLFEAMAWLSRYVAEQPLPVRTIGFGDALSSAPVPPETPSMTESRARYEEILADAETRGLFGAGATRSIRLVLEGMNALQGGDLDAAETALSEALGVPELVWLADELAFARAKVRTLAGDPAGARADIEAVLRARPRSAAAHHCKAQILMAEGLGAKAAGGDAKALFEASIAACGAGLDRAPDRIALRLDRAMVSKLLGDFLLDIGEDPGPRYRDSLEDGTAVLAAEPGNPQALNGRGNVLEALGALAGARGQDARDWHERALADFDRALEADPGYLIVHHNRANTLGSLAELARRAGEDPLPLWEEAVRGYTRFLEARPGSPLALQNRCLTLCRMGEFGMAGGRDPRALFQRAVADADAALEADSGDADLLNQRAIALRGLAHAETLLGRDAADLVRKAMASLDRAILAAPGFVSAYNNRGNCRLDMGRIAAAAGDPGDWFALAEEDFSKALDLKPSDVKALANRGNARLARAEGEARDPAAAAALLRAALDDCREALRRDPGHLDGALFLGNAAWALGKNLAAGAEDPRPVLEEAVSGYERFLAGRRGAAYALNNLANALIALGEARACRAEDPGGAFGRALRAYDEAIAGNALLWQPHANRGVLLAKLGRFEEARDAFETSWRMTEGKVPSIGELLEEARRDCTAPPWYRRLRHGCMMVVLGDYGAARPALEEGLEAAGAQDAAAGAGTLLAAAAYNLACIHAQLSAGKAAPKATPRPVEAGEAARHATRALACLERALSLGWKDLAQLETDSDLAPLRSLPAFQALLEKAKEGE